MAVVDTIKVRIHERAHPDEGRDGGEDGVAQDPEFFPNLVTRVHMLRTRHGLRYAHAHAQKLHSTRDVAHAEVPALASWSLHMSHCKAQRLRSLIDVTTAPLNNRCQAWVEMHSQQLQMLCAC